MSFTPEIQIFCCHYTSQQAIAEGSDGLKEDGLPEGAVINRLPCSGKLQVSTLLKAFENGADAVCVIGCPTDKCHNVLGSQRAAHRVLAVRKALAELGTEAERIEMFHLERGFHPEFIEAVIKMDERARSLGASPFKDEKPAKKETAKPAAKTSARPAPKKAGAKTAKKAVKKGGKKK